MKHRPDDNTALGERGILRNVVGIAKQEYVHLITTRGVSLTVNRRGQHSFVRGHGCACSESTRATSHHCGDDARVSS